MFRRFKAMIMQVNPPFDKNIPLETLIEEYLICGDISFNYPLDSAFSDTRGDFFHKYMDMLRLMITEKVVEPYELDTETKKVWKIGTTV